MNMFKKTQLVSWDTLISGSSGYSLAGLALICSGNNFCSKPSFTPRHEAESRPPVCAPSVAP